uniref:Uncharacterized protein n=1 Tax=Chromera velia CCMP2878 TaxID=1169474 RepID=A0A0G4HQU0_9ALVE|eukprot:Cvel_7992.t1-p1 / transcript=Cvel_7992.t1 / gene=Cvel_7992 / organism=Chromera_velia_CCMP2878 / gene_product=hypothetical protein / transcript_product=hypothetical protein / location=Cvel_scaffold430:64995-65936(-) / protein_length=314 / sequence_SO=supercontig / SO=protein_coding / is_pseudo=false
MVHSFVFGSYEVDLVQVVDFLCSNDGKIDRHPTTLSYVPAGFATFDTEGNVVSRPKSDGDADSIDFTFADTGGRWRGRFGQRKDTDYRHHCRLSKDSPALVICYDPDYRNSFEDAQNEILEMAFQARLLVRKEDVLHQEKYGRYKIGSPVKVGERMANVPPFLCILAAVKQRQPLQHLLHSANCPPPSPEKERVCAEEGRELAADLSTRHEGRAVTVFVEIDLTSPPTPYAYRDTYDNSYGSRDYGPYASRDIEPPVGIKQVRKLMAQFALANEKAGNEDRFVSAAAGSSAAGYAIVAKDDKGSGGTGRGCALM